MTSPFLPPPTPSTSAEHRAITEVAIRPVPFAALMVFIHSLDHTAIGFAP